MRLTYPKRLFKHPAPLASPLRGMSHEFRVVRRYGTFSTYSFTEAKKCAGSWCTRSVWFKRIEPPRTFSNLIMTERAGRVAFLHVCSGWFGCTEPPSLTVCRVLVHSFGVVQVHRTASNLLEPPLHRASKVCRWLPHRRSGWFAFTEPSTHAQSLQGLTSFTGVRGGSPVPNLL